MVRNGDGQWRTRTTSRGKRNLRIFLSSPGSWMTVVLFQLFGLPCLFCAHLCRSCLDDLKIFYYEQKLRSTQHPNKRWPSSKWPPNNANTKRDLLQLTTSCNSSGNVHRPTHTTHTCMVQSRCVLVDEKIYSPNKKNYLSNLPITWLVDTKHTRALVISFAGLLRTSNK